MQCTRSVHDMTHENSDQNTVDVVVIGGGAGGLAAAVALARSRRDVVVVDAGEPRNATADGAHNVLGNEGIPPQELLARGRREAESYGARILAGRATDASGSLDDFEIEVDDGAQRIRARRVILATGLIDELPDVPGIAEAWGSTVLHCPFCHGWEVRDTRIAILARDPNAVHQAMLFRQLSDRVTFIRHEEDALDDDGQRRLTALEIPVVSARIERVEVDGTRVRALRLAGGERQEVDAVVVAPRFHARTDLYEALGGQAETTAFGQQIPVDERGMTSIPGVWAAGNSSQPMAMVTGAMASGLMAGAAVHGDLAAADLERRLVATATATA